MIGGTACPRAREEGHEVRNALPDRALYTVPEAMAMLDLSRTIIYDSVRPPTDGNARSPSPGSSFINDGVRRSSSGRSDARHQCPHAVAAARVRFTGMNHQHELSEWPRPTSARTIPAACEEGLCRAEPHRNDDVGVTSRRGADRTGHGQPHSCTVRSLLPLSRHLGYDFLPVPPVGGCRDRRRGTSPGGRPDPSRRGVQPIRRLQPAAGTVGTD
jgi:hypothetical protein